MVKKYTPKNRYCRNTKLSEDEFAQAVSAFMDGLGAAALARKNGRSERAMRSLFTRIRERIMSDEHLSGWMGGGSDKLPPGDDRIWPLIYDCMAGCNALITSYTSTSPAYVSQFRGVDPEGDHTQRVLTFDRKTHGTDCTNCPLGFQFRFDRTVREEWGKHELRTGGIPRSNFKPHYFEIMFRTNIRVKNTKFPEASRRMSTAVILDRFTEEPL